MAKKYKNMNHAELTHLCKGRFAFKKKPTRKEMIFLLSTNEKAKPVIEQVKTEPELSETPVIGDEQANAPTKETVIIGDELRRPISDLKPLPDIEMTPPLQPDEEIVTEATVDKTEETAPKVTPPVKPKSATITRPEVEVDLKPSGGYEVKPSPSAEERIMPGGPTVRKKDEPFTLLCAGCKGIFKAEVMRICEKCKLYFCEVCAKPGDCHVCGKALSK